MENHYLFKKNKITLLSDPFKVEIWGQKLTNFEVKNNTDRTVLMRHFWTWISIRVKKKVKKINFIFSFNLTNNLEIEEKVLFLQEHIFTRNMFYFRPISGLFGCPKVPFYQNITWVIFDQKSNLGYSRAKMVFYFISLKIVFQQHFMTSSSYLCLHK